MPSALDKLSGMCFCGRVYRIVVLLSARLFLFTCIFYVSSTSLHPLTLSLSLFIFRHLVRDLWLREDRGSFTQQYAVSVASHAVIMIKVTKATA